MTSARLALTLALVTLLAGVSTASAEDTRPPRDLWSEFPLEPAQTTAAPPAPAPLTPPTLGPSAAVPGAEEVVTSDDMSSRWLWTGLIVASGLGALGFLLIRRRLVDWGAAPTRAALSVGSRTRALVVSLSSVAGHAGLRPPPRELRRFSFQIDPELAQLGPCAIHRVGLVRQRFVAEAARADQGERRIASSRPFWRFRGGGREAWNELIGELTLAGWELVPAWGAQPGDPVGAGDAWYEVQLVRAERRADLEARVAPASGPADAE
jgi:hypothetical protein